MPITAWEQFLASIKHEEAIYIDFVDNDLQRLRDRMAIRKIDSNLISIHKVSELANHRMVSSIHPRGRKCDQTLAGPGYVLMWTRRE